MGHKRAYISHQKNGLVGGKGMKKGMKKNLLVSFVVIVILAITLSACAQKPAQKTGEEGGEVARPSNPGGPGQAATMTGDATKGADTFKTTCVPCHGDQGKGGIANAGSRDGTVPALNPIDPTLKNSDAKTFAYNLDLFLEHGSTPEEAAEGTKPALSMPAFGDQKMLQPQDIANVIAYVISLNK
jgi:mono/diheme cytochrome c family protein